MHDITDRPARLDQLRREYDHAWLSNPFDPDRLGAITAQMRAMIGDDDYKPGSRKPVPTSKEDLRKMLAAAVANTPGAVPVRPALGCNSSDPDRPPTAYQIAVAIVAAARAMGVDPCDVAMGVTTHGGRYADHSIPRARAYAAFAIQRVFPHNGPTAIARWVAAKNTWGYLRVLTAQRKRGAMRWWDEAVFLGVVAKLKLAAKS